MNMPFSKLPIEIIYHILRYTGIIKYRNGKYIYQILEGDKRYELLKTIPRFGLSYDNNNYGLYIVFKKTPDNSIYRKLMSVDYDLTNGLITYCYRHLLHKEVKMHLYDSNVKFICLI